MRTTITSQIPAGSDALNLGTTNGDAVVASERIKSLTPEQIARFPEFVMKWTDIGLSTAPADRPRAEDAIRRLYETASIKCPRILWVTSPMAGAIAAPMAANMIAMIKGEKPNEAVGSAVYSAVRSAVGSAVRRAACGSTIRSTAM